MLSIHDQVQQLANEKCYQLPSAPLACWLALVSATSHPTPSQLHTGPALERSAVKLNGGGPAEGGFRVRRTARGAFCLTVRSDPQSSPGCVG